MLAVDGGLRSRLLLMQHRTLASAASRLIERVRARSGSRTALDQLEASASHKKALNDAVTEVTNQRNGYMAWSLYVALRQADVALPEQQVSALAGAMLHVDSAVHGDVAAKRTLSVLDMERQAGRRPHKELLRHAAAASAVQGLPDLAEALCDEADARGFHPASQASLAMRGSLIAACGAAQQLPRAFAQYRSLEQRVGKPKGKAHALPWPEPTVALLDACVSAGSVERAFQIVDEILSSSHRTVKLKAGAIVPLIRGCALRDDAAQASEVLALARKLNVDVRAAAVREFSRHGGPDLIAIARQLHAAATAEGAYMPLGSTTKLARACLRVGATEGVADVLGAHLADPADAAADTAAADRDEQQQEEDAARAAVAAEEEEDAPRASSPPAAASASRRDSRSSSTSSLDEALDALHSLARQERQREQAAHDQRRTQRWDDAEQEER